MTNSAHKFSFDRDLALKPVPKVALTKEQLAKKLALAEAKGFERAKAQYDAQKLAVEQSHLQELQQQFTKQLPQILAMAGEVERHVEAHAIVIVQSALKKLLPSLNARYPLPEIEAVIDQCFKGAIETPHIVVRCHPELVEQITPLCDTAKQQSGLETKVITLGDDDFGLGDCKLEWAHGGFERDASDIEAHILSAIDEYIEHLEAVVPPLILKEAPIEADEHPTTDTPADAAEIDE